jgi:predicted nucleic acid-binding protein
MAVYFGDSSAIVKRYMNETGTAWVTSITSPGAGNDIYMVQVTGVEIVSAITRARRSGRISAADATTAVSDFRYDFANGYHVVEIKPGLISHAMTLAETYALRGYDAVQLAAALEVNTHWLTQGGPPITLISADTALNAAAIAEGLTVDNPNWHP